jgi:cyclic pyranopterin phosphate synthase
MVIDQFGRTLDYLRISLTDRCNLRCIYCMPQSIRFQPTSFLMSDDEVYRLTGLFADLGFKKFRLTGGEPTVRPGILGIIHHLSQLPGVEDVVMTTNGMRLAALAQPLAHAGLRRVNISIDALDAQTFQRMTSRGDFEKVWTGIIAAERAGLTPIKLNAVIARGYNDKSVTALAKLTLNHAWQVRFIELMPLGDMASFSTQHFVSEEEMRRRIAAEFMPLLPVNDGKLDGEARLYQFPDGLGTVGFISSVSQPFCAQCNRARLTADGILRLCLLQNGEVDLLTPLRAGASDDELREMIYSGLYRKPWGHQLSADIAPVGRVMSQIGG